MVNAVPWTILKVLDWTTERFTSEGIASPRVDAEVLLAHCLATERIQLYAHFDQPLQEHELVNFRAMVKRRIGREPVAYIIGYKEFWSLALEVDREVLIPRPETELLVELALERLDGEGQDRTVVDVGTGSGAVALALKKERPCAAVFATDLSKGALAVARRNMEKLGLELELLRGDLLEPLPPEVRPDLLVSNPPYVTDGELKGLEPEVRDWEPRGALTAGADGLAIIRRLSTQAVERLTPGGWLLVEIGMSQGEATAKIFEQAGLVEIQVNKDLASLDRVVVGRRP